MKLHNNINVQYRTWLIIICIAVLIASVCVVCACSPEHVHSYVEQVTKQPTCLDEGERTFKCQCGESHTETIDATGHRLHLVAGDNGHRQECKNCDYSEVWQQHVYDTEVSVVPSTCSVAGLKTLSCVCGDTQVEQLPLAKHDFHLGYDDNEHWQQCINCNYVDGKQQHSLVNVDKVDATCTSQGSETFQCSCGYSYTDVLPLAQHQFYTTYDEDEHWQQCSACGLTKDNATHSLYLADSQSATCYQHGYEIYECEGCDYSYRDDIDPVAHKLRYKFDSDGHWKQCDNCNYATYVVKHNLILSSSHPSTCVDHGEETFTCTCGYSKTNSLPLASHSYSTYGYDDTTHWQVCSVCGNATAKVAHSYMVTCRVEATCTTFGKVTYACACGMSYNEHIPKSNHVISDYYLIDNDYHWRKCVNCGTEFEKYPHNHDQLVSERDATCTDNGEHIFACVCGAETKQELPLTDHDFSRYDYDNDNHWLVCAFCGTASDELVAHSYHTITSSAPTCTSGGVSENTCMCGRAFTVTTDALGHAISTEVTRHDSTNHYYVCIRCDYEETEKHHMVAADCPDGYTRPATCYQQGHTDLQCEVCNFLQHISIAKTDDHNFSDEWSHSGTFHWHVCTNGNGLCNARTDETQHTFETVRIEPTCTSAGYERKQCVCGEVQSGSNRTLSQLSHDYVERVITVAICTNEGEVELTCLNCGETVVETTPMLSHSWTLWRYDEHQHWHVCSQCGTEQNSKGNHDIRVTVVIEATCQHTGLAQYKCNACGYGYEEVTTANHNYYSTDEGRLDPACEELGAHWEICATCGDKQWVVDVLLGYAPHTITYYPAKDVTDDADGNLAYWHCSVCGKYFASHNCERELSEDEVFIRTPQVKVVESLAELKRIATEKYDGIESNDCYQITLTVFDVYRPSGTINLWDPVTEDFLTVTVDMSLYNIDTVFEGDVVTLKGNLICQRNVATLLNVKIVSVNCGDPDLVSLFVTVSGDISQSMLSTTSDAGCDLYLVMYGTTYDLHSFNCLLKGETITFTHLTFSDIVIRSVIVNGKAYTMTNGSLTIEVTEDLYVEFIFSHYDTDQVDVDKIATVWNAPTVQLNAYVSYRYVGNENAYGRLVQGSQLRFYVQCAYITRVTIVFEDYNLTDISDNTVNVGTDEQHKGAVQYNIFGDTATLTFDKLQRLSFFEYCANASQARIKSITVQYATYNS